MLSMVSSERHGADLRANEQENYVVEHKSIPVPVLVKHEEYSSAEGSYSPTTSSGHGHGHQRRHESGRAHDARGVLTATVHTASNMLPPTAASSAVASGAESDASAKARKEKRSTKSKCPPGLRSGKWTPEEEAFTNLIIHYFKRGLLHVEDGTSLRWYLAKRLNCEAMRVTKKLKGNSSIGKQIFRALESTDENVRAIAAAAAELAVVEAQFLESLAALPVTGTGTASASGTTSSGAAAPSTSTASTRGKKASPYKAARAESKPPQPGALHELRHTVRVDSEDARLLLHFFEEAHDTLMDSAVAERKRLFSELEGSTAAATSLEEDTACWTQASKRHSVKIENLMD